MAGSFHLRRSSMCCAEKMTCRPTATKRCQSGHRLSRRIRAKRTDRINGPDSCSSLSSRCRRNNSVYSFSSQFLVPSCQLPVPGSQVLRFSFLHQPLQLGFKKLNKRIFRIIGLAGNYLQIFGIKWVIWKILRTKELGCRRTPAPFWHRRTSGSIRSIESLRTPWAHSLLPWAQSWLCFLCRL